MQTRGLSLFLSPFLLLAIPACEHVTEPVARGGSSQQSVESTGSGGFVAAVLPNGVLSSLDGAFLVVADNGDVFGSIVQSGADRAARWSVDPTGNVGGPVLLGSLPPPFDLADQYVRFASRDGNVVLGYAQNGRGNPNAGWVWAHGTMTMLLPVPTEGRVVPFAINEAGMIVGQIASNDVDGDWGAVWLPPYADEPLLLPRLEGYSLNSARGITNDGIVSGWVRGEGMVEALVQWQIDAAGKVLRGPDILEGIDQILLSAVNQDLDMAGSFHGDDVSTPYLFRSAAGQRIDLGLLAGHSTGGARGISERAPDGSVHLVGSSFTTGGLLGGAAVLWSVVGGNIVTSAVDLGLPPATVISNRPPRSLKFVSAGAFSSNSQRWVVGWSRRDDGAFFSTLWRPSGDEPGEDEDCNPHPRTGACRR
jgi:hypothetical protein